MEVTGLEPVTFWLQTRRSPKLSYTPLFKQFKRFKRFLIMVGLSGIEPLTSRLSGVRSYHLSYRPSVWDRIHEKN